MSTATIDAEHRLRILGCVVNGESIGSITERVGLSKEETMVHIKSLLEEEYITKDQFSAYTERPKYDRENPILEMFRENVPPMRIAEKLGISRQAVYSYLASKKKKHLITEEEYQKRSKLWKRKSNMKFEDTASNLKRASKIIIKNPNDNLKQLGEKIGIKTALLKRVTGVLLEKEMIPQELHDRITHYVDKKKEDREVLVKVLCEEFKDTSFKKLALKYDMTVRGIILLVEAGIDLGFISQEEYDETVNSRRTNKGKLSQEKIEEIVEKYKNGVTINTLTREYDRCTAIIRKYINGKHRQEEEV